MDGINRFRSSSISLIVSVAFFTQLLPFGNAAFGFSSGKSGGSPQAAGLSLSPEKAAALQGLLLARSGEWGSLNAPAAGNDRMPSDGGQPKGGDSLGAKPGEWQSIKDQGRIRKTTPSASGTTAKVIGRNGGAVSSKKDGVTVTIPAGALLENTKISVSPSALQTSIDLEPGTDPNAVLLAAGCDLGPSGTRFSKPATVEMKISQEALKRVQKGDRLLVVGVTGDVIEYYTDYQLDSRGNVRFQVNHFSAWLIWALGGMILVGACMIVPRVFLSNQPHRFITPKGSRIKQFAGDGKNLKLPSKINQTGYTDLGINKTFKGSNSSFRNFHTGNSVVTWDSNTTVNCQDLSFLTASLLVASKDPRFQNFKGVGGTTAGNLHMWLEIKIDGQVYVVDTLNTKQIRMIPAWVAYEKFKLAPGWEYGYKKRKKSYVGWDGKPGADKFKYASGQGSKPDKAALDAAYKHGYRVGCSVAGGGPKADMKDEYGRYPAGSKLRENFRRGYAQGAEKCKIR